MSQIGYAASDNVRFYLDFNYAQRVAKTNVSFIALTGETIVFGLGKYKLFDFYAWCSLLLRIAGVIVFHSSLAQKLRLPCVISESIAGLLLVVLLVPFTK